MVLLLSLFALAGCGLAGGATKTPTTAAAKLSVIPSTVGFGNVVVGQTNTQTVTLKNSGNAGLTLSQADISGTGFSLTGLTLPLTLDPGQQANFNVAFSPGSASSFSGSLSLVSNATNSPSTVALSGSGVTTTSHSVDLNWTASMSTVSGYNVYRASQSAGPYTKLNSSLITVTGFTDSTVQAGKTYYYVTTAVDSNNVESVYSNQVSAAIPSP